MSWPWAALKGFSKNPRTKADAWKNANCPGNYSRFCTESKKLEAKGLIIRTLTEGKILFFISRAGEHALKEDHEDNPYTSVFLR